MKVRGDNTMQEHLAQMNDRDLLAYAIGTSEASRILRKEPTSDLAEILVHMDHLDINNKTMIIQGINDVISIHQAGETV